MDAITEALLDRNVVLLVCLDDLQCLIQHDTETEVIYPLIRMSLDYPGCRAGVIMTTGEMRADLSQRGDLSFSSTLCGEEIPFPPYTVEEIRDILRLRVRGAFSPA